MNNKMKNSIIECSTFEKDKTNYWESIFTLSNTYMGIRGIEDEKLSGSKPGLYIAGIFNQSEGLNSEIVNFPDIYSVRLKVEGETVSPETATVVDYSRKLDLYEGTLTRKVVLRSTQGYTFQINSKKFLSFSDVNCGAILYSVTSPDYSGPVTLESQFQGDFLTRAGCYDYSEKIKSFHILSINNQYSDNFYSRIKVRDRGYLVDMASHFDLVAPDAAEGRKKNRRIYGENVNESLSFRMEQGLRYKVCKYFVINDSRHTNQEQLKELTLTKLERMKSNGYSEELARSVAQLSLRWDKMDVVIEGDRESDLELRYNLYQLIAVGSEDRNCFSIGAKGLSTEHYGGHYFWDTEIYLLPYFLNTNPAVAKNLLKFRYHTLNAAKCNASKNGFDGCLWPWQSDELGEEGIRLAVLENGVIKRRQILNQYHIVSDVAWACFRFYQQTGDTPFFMKYLMPVIIESLRFWRSFLLQRNDPNESFYRFPGVMGPDEYHISSDDNFYTCYLTKHIFEEFNSFIKSASEKQLYDLETAMAVSDEELNTFRELTDKIFVPEIKDSVIEQFTGYFKLDDLEITKYSELGMPQYPDKNIGAGMEDMERQDAIQEHATRTQLIKQADAILPFCINQNDFPKEVISATYDYYDKRTLQYSSLSPGVCALGGAIAGRTTRAYELFRLGVNMDLQDQKNETATGLHTACHGGAYLAVVEGFAGIKAEADYLSVQPRLPEDWDMITCTLFYLGVRLDIKVSCSKVLISKGSSRAVPLKINGEDFIFKETQEEFVYHLKKHLNNKKMEK